MGSQQTPRSEALVGRIVGPYRVKARVRETGGLTTVIAEHLDLDRHVLLKWLTPASPAVLDRVKERTRALSRLKHRNVLPVIDIGESAEGVVYLAFELHDHAPLRSVMARRKALPWWEARRLGRQIASGVRAAQAAGLPLAEVSPSAIFLAPVEVEAEGVRVDLATPELLGLCDPSLVADQVHGLGRVLYLMVTGHEASSNTDQVPDDPVLSWPELEIPSDADALIMRAVDPVPASRWASLEVLERELGGGEVEEAVPAVVGRSSGWSTGARFTGARFSEPLGAQTDNDGSDDEAYDDRSFGRRAFAKPSKRALIAGGVAVAAGTVLLAGIVMSRGPSSPSQGDDGTGRSSNAPLSTGGAAGVMAAEPASADAVVQPSPEGNLAPVEPPTEAMRLGAAAGASGTASEGPPAADGATPSSGGGAAPQPSVAVSGLTGPVPAAGGAVGSPAPPPSGVAAAQRRSAAPAPGTTGAAPAHVAPPVAAAAPEAPNTVGLAGADARQPEPIAAATPSPPSEVCRVSLGSRPWADVWLDGRRMGFTPLTDLVVPCGPHDVVLTSTELGVERRISITLRPGEPLKRIVDLEAAPMMPGQAGEGTGGIPGVAAGCRLSLGSRPWSEVWVDGKRAGITPLTSLPVSCGRHDVLFLSRDANVERRESILVQNGELVKRTVVLVEGD